MIRTILFLVVVAAALGCGGSGPPGSVSSGNHTPVVTTSAAADAVVIGQSTQLSTTATDQDTDPLSYGWTQTSPASPLGGFSSRSAASPTWTAPTVAALTRFTLAVTVSDGRGGEATASVNVYVKTSTDTSFTAEVLPILQACTSVCHPPAGDLSLEGDSYDQLVNVPSVTCSPNLRVKPGDPNASVLFLKMIGSTCGERMPAGNPTYFDGMPAKLAAVRSWIEQGAQKN